MKSTEIDPEVRDLLLRVIDLPDDRRRQALDGERARRPQVVAAVEAALPDTDELFARLPTEDPSACHAALRRERTLSPLVAVAIEHLLTPLQDRPPEFDLPRLQLPELVPDFSAEWSEGTSFGDYLMERKLGHGGMGVVYLARDTTMPDMPLVALKVFPDINLARLQRMREEASILRRLVGETSIVPIFTHGTMPLPFIAMEYVEGGSLADVLDAGEGAWPGEGRDRPRAAAELVLRLARALGITHQCRIFHLDLKPDNVLLHPTKGPLLADFGLSQSIADEGDRLQPLGGTIAYMAPEQASGDRARGELIDVYGLGSILYELVTGRAPFVPSEGESAGDFRRRVQAEEPPRPRRLAPSLPSDLEAICLRCLRKVPGDRYPSAAALADDLQKFLDGDRPSVVRWPWHRRVRRFGRRHRVGVVIGTLVALLFGSALFTYVVHLHHVAGAAEAEARRQREQGYRGLVETARKTAERGDWRLALELYDQAAGQRPADAPERLALEVERMPGWFLHRSRQEVEEELTRLGRSAELPERARALVCLYEGDLRMCREGRTPAALARVRESLAAGALDESDARYAEALVAPTSGEAVEKLRGLVKDRPGHYRARVALLGLLLVRGELGDLRDHLKLHAALYPDDPTAAMLGAWLDVLEKDDVQAALDRIGRVRGRLGEERAKRWQTFLVELVKLLRTLEGENIPNPLAILRLKVITGDEKDVFSLNVPTGGWLSDHWGAAARAMVFATPTLLLDPESALKRWESVCADSPEATFLVPRALAEAAVCIRLEQQDPKKSLEHAGRAVELAYQAADPRTPTLLPRSEWRYKALLMGLLTEAAFLQTRGEPAEPWRERRLREAVRRAVTEGRAHRAFRDEQLPKVVAGLLQVSRLPAPSAARLSAARVADAWLLAAQAPCGLATAGPAPYLLGAARWSAPVSPSVVPAELPHALLVEWMQDDPGNPIPYRLRGQLALEEDHPETAWAVVTEWYTNGRQPRDPRLDEIGRAAQQRLGARLGRLAGPAR